jgi:hypothetical protein
LSALLTEISQDFVRLLVSLRMRFTEGRTNALTT